jgi:hypothetical protein
MSTDRVGQQRKQRGHGLLGAQPGPNKIGKKWK